MSPTDFPQSRAHPRATYPGIFPLLLLLSRLSRYSKRGLFVPARAAVSIFRNSNKNTADAMSYHNDRIRYRKRKKTHAKICNNSFQSLAKIRIKFSKYKTKNNMTKYHFPQIICTFYHKLQIFVRKKNIFELACVLARVILTIARITSVYLLEILLKPSGEERQDIVH